MDLDLSGAHFTLAFLQALCEQVPQGICLFDEAGRYVLANAAYCAIHGYSSAELIGQPFTLTLPPAVRDLGMQIHQDVLDGVAYPPAEWLVRRKDGTNIPVHTSNSTLRQPDGARLRMVVVADVSERRRLEEERDALREQLLVAASTDALTRVHNRVALLQAAEQELQRARRYGYDLTVVLFDLDHFRQINEAHGPHVGDEVLRLVAATCRQLIRVSDTVGRYSGEEFAILLPMTDHSGGMRMARRLRKAITAREWPTSSGAVAIAASFGVGTSEPDDTSSDLTLMRASAALYVAKQRGHNHVVSAAALAR